MQFKRPENTEKYYWTRHCVGKMMQYGLSAQRITRVIRAPERIVEGVAKNTIAVMQPSSTRRDEKGNKKWSQEIWVMYQLRRRNVSGKNKETRVGDIDILKNNFVKNIDKAIFQSKQIKIISAWRYPGMSPKGSELPEEIIEEIRDAGIADL